MDHTIRLVRWGIEKVSDMVKQKCGGVARQYDERDMYRSAEDTEEGRARSHTPPSLGDPKQAIMAVMGDSKKSRPGSKCNCCFETHGSRSGI